MQFQQQAISAAVFSVQKYKIFALFHVFQSKAEFKCHSKFTEDIRRHDKSSELCIDLFLFSLTAQTCCSASSGWCVSELTLTVSFFLLNTGMATEVMSSRLWALVVKSWETGEHWAQSVIIWSTQTNTQYNEQQICNRCTQYYCPHYTKCRWIDSDRRDRTVFKFLVLHNMFAFWVIS